MMMIFVFFICVVFSASIYYVVNRKKGDGFFWIIIYLSLLTLAVSITSVPPHIASVFLGSLTVAVFEVVSSYWEKSLVTLRLSSLTKCFHKD